jgi:hypothetical protein
MGATTHFLVSLEGLCNNVLVRQECGSTTAYKPLLASERV